MRGELLAMFSPNKAVSKKSMLLIIGVQSLMLLIIWLYGPSRVVPRPMEVLTEFSALWRNGIGVETWNSIATNAVALSIALVFSLILSYLTVLAVFKPVAEAVSKLRFLGMTGLVFLFTILTRTGHQLKVALLVFGISVFFVTSMVAIVADIPRDEYDYARTLRMGRWRVVWEVVILGRLDQVFEVLRQNAAMGWMMLTMVEGLVRSEGGLGAMMLNENKHFNLAAVFAIQFLILGIGLLQDYLIGVVKNMVCPYAALAVERK